MVMKDNGKSKRKTFLKCDGCRQRFELIEEDIVRIEKFSYVECPFCGEQNLLKN
jgi:DNA-directed RNA polymerase subunit RPC12/RpoP